MLRRAFAAAFEDALRRGVDSGDLTSRNPALSAAALVGAVGEVLTGPLQSGVAATDTVPELVAFALRALGARP